MKPELTFSRFEKSCETYPNNIAIIFLGEKFSYRKLHGMVNRFATGLAGLGLKKGDRVILYLSNCVQFVISFLAAQRLGLVVVLVSPIYTSHELEYMVNDSGARAIVCHDTNYGYVKEVFDKTSLEKIIYTNLIDMVSITKRTIAYLFDKTPHGTVKGGNETMSFKTLLKNPANPPEVSIDPVQDLSYILYTGGTTGFPKGVPGNHWGHTSYVNDITDWLTVGHLQHGKDVYIAINPLFHIMALGLFMAVGLNVGATTVLMPVPQVDAILMEIERRKVRWMLGVPALYRMILENDRQDTYDISSLKYCFCGGDVLPREVLHRWKQRANVPIYQVYGSTEAGHVSYSPLGAGDPAPMSIGFPLPSRKPLIIDPETVMPVPVGQVGELMVTSEHSIKEYLNKASETTASFVKIGSEIFYRTNDFVRGSDTGEIFYVERSADILKHKGYRVSASEVEAVLQDHPVVVGACVIGVPDKKVGERIKAIVVLKDDAKGVGAAELINWCSSQLASYKVPSYIEFRDMLPKSKVGKLLRREIREEEKRRVEKDKK
jgi:long-chain acyl-CoA synthetase